MFSYLFNCSAVVKYGVRGFSECAMKMRGIKSAGAAICLAKLVWGQRNGSGRTLPRTCTYVAGLVEAVFAAQSQDCRAKGEGYTRRDEIGQLGDTPRYVCGARDTRVDNSIFLL